VVKVLGLPAGTRACLFDLDGVLTPTAAVHAAAWQETFDPVTEHDEYVDGKARAAGIDDLIKARVGELLDRPEMEHQR
jgi:beta-phosphoglucomutase-like phosphatase (HAD superfamily)